MDNKNKKSLASMCGYALGTFFAICVTAVLMALIGSITAKIIMSIFNYILL